MRESIAFLLLIISVAQCDPCPSGYTQAPNGGDCYLLMDYYQLWIQQYFPQTFEGAELDCNAVNHGGLLASIHSQEESDYVDTLRRGHDHCSWNSINIGLRCTGNKCGWDDGSPVTYTYFEGDGSGPPDDGKTRCVGTDFSSPYWTWKNCGEYQEDCWLCSIKAKTIECADGETEYRGGCISVHTSALDQKSAEASCPGGGHLVSIHSVMTQNGAVGENSFYTKTALNGGAKGTVYIGGQYSNGKFEWLDGSASNAFNWANGFPNTVFGTCVQMLLSSEFGSQGQWTNVDCSTKQSYMCFRNGDNYGPTLVPPPPKADPHCPASQVYTGSGSIYSPNYPLSIPAQQSCEYVLGVTEGEWVSVNFPTFNCQSGTTLSLIDGLNNNQPFITFNSTSFQTSPSPTQWYTATSNVMKIVFKSTAATVGTGWEAQFDGI